MMLGIDIKKRISNKAFWISICSLLLLLSQQLGLNLNKYIPQNYVEIINTIFAIFIALGVTVDTSSKGLSDTVIAQATVQAVNDATDTKSEVKAESTTTAINNTVTENSVSAQIDDKNAIVLNSTITPRENTAD